MVLISFTSKFFVNGFNEYSIRKAQRVFNPRELKNYQHLSETQKLKENFLEKRKKPYAYDLHLYRV